MSADRIIGISPMVDLDDVPVTEVAESLDKRFACGKYPPEVIDPLGEWDRHTLLGIFERKMREEGPRALPLVIHIIGSTLDELSEIDPDVRRVREICDTYSRTNLPDKQPQPSLPIRRHRLFDFFSRA